MSSLLPSMTPVPTWPTLTSPLTGTLGTIVALWFQESSLSLIHTARLASLNLLTSSVQAAIPNLSCSTPTNTPPINYPTAHVFISEKHAGPVQLILTGRINITVITVKFLICLNQRRLNDNKCFTHFFHTESVSEDTADSMVHSFSSDRKKAPQLDTNKGLFDLLILYTLGLHHILYDYACCSISNCFQ